MTAAAEASQSLAAEMLEQRRAAAQVPLEELRAQEAELIKGIEEMRAGAAEAYRRRRVNVLLSLAFIQMQTRLATVQMQIRDLEKIGLPKEARSGR